ncbi:MAG: histidine phosphatase family protein [Velocimicrobium sp.]
MKLYLLRHGKTEANKQRLYCGQTDIGLCREGREELLKQKETIVYPKADIYIVTGLKRTRETLEILYKDQPCVCMTEWNEMNFGSFEMKSYEELRDRAAYQNWIQNIEKNPCPMGESQRQFKDRIQTGLKQLEELFREENDRSVLAITHGGVISEIMEKFFPNQKNFYEWQPSFGRGYFVDINDTVNYTII